MIYNIDRDNLHLSRGSGIGSIFSSIFRGLVPLARNIFSVGKQFAKSDTGQKIIKAAKRTALDTGLDLAHDTLSGEKKLKQAIKSRLNLKQLASKFDDNVKKSFRGGKSRKKMKMRKKITKKKRNICRKNKNKITKRKKKVGRKRVGRKRVGKKLKKYGKKVRLNRKKLLDMWL